MMNLPVDSDSSIRYELPRGSFQPDVASENFADLDEVMGDTVGDILWSVPGVVMDLKRGKGSNHAPSRGKDRNRGRINHGNSDAVYRNNIFPKGGLRGQELARELERIRRKQKDIPQFEN